MIEFAAARLVLAFHCCGRLNNSDMKRIVLQKKLKVNSIEPTNKKMTKERKILQHLSIQNDLMLEKKTVLSDNFIYCDLQLIQSEK